MQALPAKAPHADRLLDTLAELNLIPTDEQRAEIEACLDAERLRRWSRAALRATSVAEVLALE